MSSRRFAGIFLAAICFAVLPCFAGAITPDGSWYNFWNLSGNNFSTAGTSCTSGPPGCTEPYFNPGDPPWTFTVPNGDVGLLTVTDGGHQGDIFQVFNNNVSIGSTSSVAVNTSHDCGGFPTACLADPNESHGTFSLSAGDYSLTIKEIQFFEPSSVAWFNVTLSAAPPTTPPSGSSATPEPGTCGLIGAALLGVGFLRRRAVKR